MTTQTAPDPWAEWDAGNIVDLTAKDARPPLRVAFYGRCSTEDLQDPETSRGWQYDRAISLLDYAEPGHSIEAEFFDIGESRSLPMKRRTRGMQLLAELDSPDRTWNAVVIGETARCFAGSQFSAFEPILRNRGVVILVPELNGPFDHTNSAHPIQMSLHGELGAAERQKVQIRVKAGMETQTLQQGRHLGGRPPYGYDAVGYKEHPNPRKASEGYQLKRLEPNVHAPVVRRMFEEVLAGKSLRAIAVDLNREGILCPSAADATRNKHRIADGWQVGTVRAILANPKYTGFQAWGRKKKVEELYDPNDESWGYKTRFVNSERPPVRSAQPAHEAIVSVPTWTEVQAVLRGRAAGGLKAMAKGTRTRTDGVTQALKGLVYCAHCERRMWPDKGQRASRAKVDRSNGQVRPGRKPKARHEQVVRIRYRCRRRDLTEGSPVWVDHPTSVVVEQKPVMDQVVRWLMGLFAGANRESTIDALTAGLDVTSLVDVRHQQNLERLADARKRLDNFLDAIGEGIVDAATLKPKMDATRKEIEDLTAASREHKSKPTVTREDVEALVDLMAERADEVFGADADPKELNDFFNAIGLRVTVDGVNRTGRAEARLTPGMVNPPTSELRRGVNEGVRGGT